MAKSSEKEVVVVAVFQEIDETIGRVAPECHQASVLQNLQKLEGEHLDSRLKCDHDPKYCDHNLIR